MGQQAEHKKTSKAGWSRQTEPPYASTGSFRRAVDLPATRRSTGAQDVEGPTMGLRDAIEQRKLEPLTPYVTVPTVTLARKVGPGLQDLQTRARRILAERNAEEAEENTWISRMVVAESIGELDGLIKSRAA